MSVISFYSNSLQNDLLNSSASKFITFSVDFAEAFFSRCPSFARVPFQLIDDFLEDKNISQAKEIWPLLESLAEKLTSATLFPKGKFIMLKTCNFLLKKLSKSCDTEVMFLTNDNIWIDSSINQCLRWYSSAAEYCFFWLRSILFQRNLPQILLEE